jgi:hypothetical protein
MRQDVFAHHERVWFFQCTILIISSNLAFDTVAVVHVREIDTADMLLVGLLLFTALDKAKLFAEFNSPRHIPGTLHDLSRAMSSGRSISGGIMLKSTALCDCVHKLTCDRVTFRADYLSIKYTFLAHCCFSHHLSRQEIKTSVS